jgi:ketosteroid isomerase-like protein
MTSENVQRVHESLRAMERGDVDAILAQSDPEVDFVNPPSAVEPGTRHGPEGLRAALMGMLEVFDELRFDTEQVIDLGDRLVATGLFTGRGRGSGAQFDPVPFGFIVTLRDGRMIRYEWFAGPQEALQAAGLEARLRGINPSSPDIY